MATIMGAGFDKSLYGEQGLLDYDNEQDEGPGLEITIENPDAVTLDDGSVEITLEPDGGDSDFDSNLAEDMDASDLTTVVSEIEDLVNADINSRKDWADTYVKGLEVMGFKYEARTEPWDGACGVFSTLLAEAAIRFQSETIMETFPAAGPVKTQIIGASDKDKEEAAERVREDMNYQLTERMTEYRSEHERMLFNLGLAGAAFKKVYFDPSLDRQVSIFLPAEDVIIPYGAANIETSERVTHLMRKTKNDIRKLQVAGFYCEVELNDPVHIPTDIEKKKAEEQGFTVDDDDRYQVCEVHIDYDLPGYEDPEGIALPYVVTYERGTLAVLSIRRNWEESDKRRLKRQHFVQYNYVPGFGVYGMGLIHIIGGYARAGTSIIRQLVDAGTLSNLPGGLKSRGLRIKGDDTPIAPGEFRDVDVPSGSIRDNVMPLPYKEPSQVLMSLLDRITEEGRRLGAISDMDVSDMSANSPVGTTLALLERTLKTMSAVQARVHYSMKQEFKLLAGIIRDYTPTSYEYMPDNSDTPQVKQADYDLVEVIPVSDPNSSTMAQRIMQYQAVQQLAASAPDIYDMAYLHRQMLEVLGIRNADKIIPNSEEAKPVDPVSENMAVLKGTPVKAFIHQDHEAHITTHTTFMQDPMIAAQMGQNPQAQTLMGALQAHIAEHLGFRYRNQIEERLGVTMPSPDVDIPPEIEAELSRMIAQAAQQLLTIHQGEAAQQKAQEQAQDPLVQMQQQELQIRQQDMQRKMQKDQADAALAQQRLQLEAQNRQAQTAMAQQKQQTDAALAQQRLQSEAEKRRADTLLEEKKLQISKDKIGVEAHLRAAQISKPNSKG